MTNVCIIHCKAVVLAPHSALRNIYGNKKVKRGMEYRTDGTKTEKWMHEWGELEGRQMWKTCNRKKEEAEIAETGVYFGSSWSKWNGKKQNEAPLVKNISGMHKQTANKVKFNDT